jgi:hypothetical protein
MLPNLLQMQQIFKEIFPELSDDSRVWLYLANRKLDATELHYASEKLFEFLSTWKAHGKSLTCNATILFSQYLVISVDEEIVSASGCSIDSSVHFVKSLGNELKVDFFNRMNVLSYANESEIRAVNYFDAVNNRQSYLNPLIDKLEDLRSNWLITAK